MTVVHNEIIVCQSCIKQKFSEINDVLQLRNAVQNYSGKVFDN